MADLITLVVSVLVFGVVILVHESGHFLAARHCGIGVVEFSIGFGPVLFSKEKNGTRYTLRLLPIGGYNLLSGMDETQEDGAASREKVFPAVVRGRRFAEASAWQRFFVIASGAGMNFALGFALLLVLAAAQPVLGGTTIAEFTQQPSLAEESGLRTGDTILLVDDTLCLTVREVSTALADGLTHRVVVWRDGGLHTVEDVSVRPTLDEDGQIINDLDFKIYRIDKTPLNILRETASLFGYYSRAIVGTFWELFTGGTGVQELSGPVGVVSAVGKAVGLGWREVLSLAALLTVNLGVFNLLPIPALDGFKLIFLAFEGVTGLAVPQRIQNAVNMAGMVLLLWFMLFITIQDIGKFI